jgi:hypothetical protein
VIVNALAVPAGRDPGGILVNVRRLPLDPPWLLVPFVAGLALATASVSIESWSIAFTYLGIALAGVPTAVGIDRWLERTHPRPRR